MGFEIFNIRKGYAKDQGAELFETDEQPDSTGDVAHTHSYTG